MRRICLVSMSIFVFFGFSYGKCVAFYYWNNPPSELLYAFDTVILDPDNVDNIFLENIETYNKKAKILGYLSLGEIETYRKDYKKTREDWILGKNRRWNTFVADIRNEEYRRFLMQKIDSMFKKGFDGVFFDTLDSYQLVFSSEKKKKDYESKIVEFIKEVKVRYPEKIIAINRGFEIYQQVKDYIDFVVVENLLTYYDFKDKKYKNMPWEHTENLLDILQKISKTTPVVVIDYADPKNKEKVKSILNKIKSYGLIPYVSNYRLNIIGYSECTPQPRRALLLYNSDYHPFGEKDPYYSYVHRMSQLFVEYYGLVPEIIDVQEGLPEGFLADRYKLIVVWINDAPNPDKFFKWILDKINQGIKVVFIDSFGFNISQENLKKLGIKMSKSEDNHWKLIKEKSKKWFEIVPFIENTKYVLKPEGKPVFTFKNKKGQVHIPAAITKWGGYALEGTYVRTFLYDLYVIDPFDFYKDILGSDVKLIPDTTTESGKRILFVHIDGDGFNQKTVINTRKYVYASEVIQNEIIRRFDIPHSVSVIEGEIAPWGAYPDEDHEKLENIARSIFQMENVEPASHSFSHPFNWYGILFNSDNPESHYNLKIKNYKFDLKREIVGSVKYIQKTLLKNKKSVKMFFWTGDCVPPKEALEITYRFKLYNINGGDTYITYRQPSLSFISPLGVNRGRYFQVYAQVQNDNVYTKGMSNPYGYKDVIQTFKLTDKNYRLKPIDIYYHFFSGRLYSSLKALIKVYKWSIKQDVIPMYTSDYIKIALDSRVTTIKKAGDRYILKNNGDLRTFRIEKKQHIDLIKSKGVAGYRFIKGKTYISVDSSGDYKIVLSKKKPENTFHLISSNARVKNVKIEKNSFYIHLKGYKNIYFDAYIGKNCRLKFDPDKVFINQFKGKTRVYIKSKEAKVYATCRN